MTKMKSSIAAVVVALGVAGGAQASPVFVSGGNGVYFANFENLYRSTEACAAGGCLSATTEDPQGYQRIDSSIAGNVRVDDIFVGVLGVQEIKKNITGNSVWFQGSGDFFTGYFVQQVTNVALADPTKAVITLGTATADPFGILSAGEMFRFYTGANVLTTSGTLASSIASATSNAFWASFGLGKEGYAYTNTDLSTSVYDSNTEALLGLDFVTKGVAYNGGAWNKVNDSNESVRGGSTLSFVCSAADIANPTVSCLDAVGTSEIEANENYSEVGGDSPWMFASNDPFKINRIPEPSSVALLGLALAGLGYSRRRKIY